MNTERRRHGRGEWITRMAAERADVRTPADAIAFLICGALVALLVWMVTHPKEFFDFVMGIGL